MTSPRTIVAFEAFGARIRVTSSGSVPRDFQPRLPPGATPRTGNRWDTTYAVREVLPPSPSGPARYELFRDGASVRASSELDEVRLEMESDMHFRVALHARGYLFVHAGVVEWNEEAIVVPGRSGSGKSSLVMALVRAGARYGSDEFAVLDGEGKVHPYRKPLSQRREGARPRLHVPESLGPPPPSGTLRLGVVVLTRFRSGARWAPSPVSRAEALMALFENTVVARSRPDFALSVLKRAVAGSEALYGERGEAEDTASALLKARGPSGE